MKRKVLHVIDSLNLGGAENLLCNTISEQKEFQHLIVSIFSSKGSSLVPPAAHISLEASKIQSIPFKFSRFRQIVKEFKPDIVHSHLYFATIFTKAFTPRRIPLVFTQHFEFSKNAAKWYYGFIDRMVSKKRHYVIAVSNVVLRDYVQSTHFNGRAQVINNYVPELFFQKTCSYQLAENENLKLVAIGNIKPIKNYQYLMDAFQLMRDLPVTCDVFGGGAQLAEFRTAAENNKIRITFQGEVPDASKVLSKYHIFVMPSLTEGFPLALFEAMASGLPVAVSDIPVFHEVLENEGNYFSLNSPENLRTIVESYLRSPMLLHKDGLKMKDLAASKASKEEYFNKINTLYREIFRTSEKKLGPIS